MTQIAQLEEDMRKGDKLTECEMASRKEYDKYLDKLLRASKVIPEPKWRWFRKPQCPKCGTVLEKEEGWLKNELTEQKSFFGEIHYNRYICRKEGCNYDFAGQVSILPFQ